MTTQKLEKIREFLKRAQQRRRNGLNFNSHVDLAYFADQLSDEPTADEFYDLLEDNNAFDVEIIYYSTAIKYLAENDASLRESLELAGEMGFKPENLDSAILASLLASQEVREEWHNVKYEIDEFFSELNNEDEDEDEYKIQVFTCGEWTDTDTAPTLIQALEIAKGHANSRVIDSDGDVFTNPVSFS